MGYKMCRKIASKFTRVTQDLCDSKSCTHSLTHSLATNGMKNRWRAKQKWWQHITRSGSTVNFSHHPTNSWTSCKKHHRVHNSSFFHRRAKIIFITVFGSCHIMEWMQNLTFIRRISRLFLCVFFPQTRVFVCVCVYIFLFILLFTKIHEMNLI